ncbi:MAG: hypothetical protein ABII07_00375 [Patescibacteria group bacterium]|nr:hypothetical protein [Patescibacteria group bacterium]
MVAPPETPELEHVNPRPWFFTDQFGACWQLEFVGMGATLYRSDWVYIAQKHVTERYWELFSAEGESINEYVPDNHDLDTLFESVNSQVAFDGHHDRNGNTWAVLNDAHGKITTLIRQGGLKLELTLADKKWRCSTPTEDGYRLIMGGQILNSDNLDDVFALANKAFPLLK